VIHIKYLITYDLNKPGQNYEDLYKAITETGSSYRHGMQNIWFVETSTTGKAIRDFLIQYIDTGDKLFVTRLNDWASYNLGNVADWLNS